MKVIVELKKIFEAERFPSTILLYGGYSITTQSVVNTVSQTLLCENKIFEGCKNCQACNLFLAGNHPDFFKMDIEESSKVEDIREALRMYSLKPYLKTGRVTILENADRLSAQSANLLLKTLEEPLNDSYFILTASQTSKLPITILSRCQKFFLGGALDEIVDLREYENKIFSNFASETDLGFLTEDEKKILYVGDESLIEKIAENKEKWLLIKESLTKIISGDGSEAVLLSRDLTKDKDKEALKINSAILIQAVRIEMLLNTNNNICSKLATVLTNLIAYEYLAYERNLSAANTLLTAFLPLLDKNFIVSVKDENLLSEIVV